jgi:hypothetical protein
MRIHTYVPTHGVLPFSPFFFLSNPILWKLMHIVEVSEGKSWANPVACLSSAFAGGCNHAKNFWSIVASVGISSCSVYSVKPLCQFYPPRVWIRCQMIRVHAANFRSCRFCFAGLKHMKSQKLETVCFQSIQCSWCLVLSCIERCRPDVHCCAFPQPQSFQTLFCAGCLACCVSSPEDLVKAAPGTRITYISLADQASKSSVRSPDALLLLT